MANKNRPLQEYSQFNKDGTLTSVKEFMKEHYKSLSEENVSANVATFTSRLNVDKNCKCKDK